MFAKSSKFLKFYQAVSHAGLVSKSRFAFLPEIANLQKENRTFQAMGECNEQ